MKSNFRIAFAAALLSTVAVPALAADLPSAKAPVYAPIVDDSFDPFLIRVRALGVLPNGSSSTILGGPIYGASLSDNVVPEVDFTYFFTKHWAAELIAGVAHTSLTGSLTPVGTNVNFANTTLLPPTLTLQYHFALGQFDPYVGVGANYTWFLQTTSPLTRTLGYGDAVTIKPTAGLALQAGFDYYLTKHWVLNADAKYLFLNTDANTPFGPNTVHVNADTWLIGVGVGYRFGMADLFPTPVVAKY
ncbi:OmpW family protein [Rhodoblastus sp.]|uniref:OmpW/AlkL family protein n=1 Tax=Rhodoblastus sp. TaxID=1962975 RepID=UPI0035B37B4E